MASAGSRHIGWWRRCVWALPSAALWCVGKLPFWVLWGLSDLLCLLVRDVVRYRRGLVAANIAASFPELTIDEQKDIARRFYRHLTDYFVETLKFATMSERAIRRRMTFADTQLIDRTLASGRNIVIYTSHFGNWEWITSMSLWCRTSAMGPGRKPLIDPEAEFAHIYRPLKSGFFDRFFLRLRSRFNVSVPMHGAFRQLLTWRRQNVPWICGFLSDQKPSHNGATFKVPFLGRETPFIGGTEELAQKLDAVVMMFDTSVRGRGRYHSVIRLLTDDPRSLPPGEITRRYAYNLEEQIRRTPQAYLWSHNRWRLPKNNFK